VKGHVKAFKIDLNAADELEVDGLAALGAAGKDFVLHQRHLFGEVMFPVEDTIDSTLRNLQTGPIADCAHVQLLPQHEPLALGPPAC